jgi:hypothetical protein
MRRQVRMAVCCPMSLDSARRPFFDPWSEAMTRERYPDLTTIPA